MTGEKIKFTIKPIARDYVVICGDTSKIKSTRCDMTEREAKRRLEFCRDFLAKNYPDMGEVNFGAFNMAIKALEQKPCDDCISRQAVLEITAETGALETQTRIKSLPPVTPQEPKTGHWISDGYKTEADWICGRITYKCPFCSYHDNYSDRSNYCPNCGAKLESEET